MIKTIRALLARIFGEKTLEDILGSFSKTIEELDAFIKSQQQAATDKTAQAAQLTSEAAAATLAAQQATATQSKLADLIRG